METAETLEASETLENQCLSKLKRFGGISEVFPRQFWGILEVSEEYSKEHNYWNSEDLEYIFIQIQ